VGVCRGGKEGKGRRKGKWGGMVQAR